MAEDKRFELLRQLPACTLSKGVHSTTMRILQAWSRIVEKKLGFTNQKEKFHFLSFFYILSLTIFIHDMSLTEKISSFFQNLGISLESVDVRENGEDLDISVKTPDSSLLIGMHGKNLEAFTHILGRIAEKQDGKYYHVHLEVNDYMKAKDERFFSFLESKISFAMSSGKSVRIPNLSSFERKKAHNYISEKAIE